MPQVKKQTTSPIMPRKASSNGEANDPWDRIAPIQASKIGRMKVSLYGMTKTGKTRLGCTFPKPLAIFGAEDGTASVVGTSGVDYLRLSYGKTIEEFRLLTEGVGSGRGSCWKRDGKGKWIECERGTGLPYASVLVDHCTKFRDVRISEILGLRDVVVQKGFGLAGRDQWTECAYSLKEMYGPLLDLPRVMDLNVIMIAHEGTLSGEDSASSSDLIKPAVGLAVGKSMALWIAGECDFNGGTFIRSQTKEIKITIAGQETTQTQRTGKLEYCLRIQPDEVYTAGFRMPLGQELTTDVIVDPSYDKIVKLVRGQK